MKQPEILLPGSALNIGSQLLEIAQKGTFQLPRQSTNTVEVYVRHSANCKSKDKGRFFRNCSCMKWLYIYHGGKKEERTCKTRSWTDAEKQAQAIRDSWDPEKIELMQLRQARDRNNISVSDAVKAYLNDLRVSGSAANTINGYCRVLGDPDGERKGPAWKGGLLPVWIAEYNRKHGTMGIFNLSDLTSEVLTKYRSSWPKDHPRWNDYTKFQTWLVVVTFFKWCVRQKYMTDNPAEALTPVKKLNLSRTAPFTDEQMEKVVSACEQYPELVPVPPEVGVRTKGIVLAMRYGGMAIADAILLKPEYIDKDGVLRYRRVKLHGRGRPAEVQLPKFVVRYLKVMPMENNSYPGYYFRTNEIIKRDVGKWSGRLKSVFQIAGIVSIETEIRKRPPHPHMFRDTLAVWCIMRDVPLVEISKMLGHSNTAITERAYLMWIEARKQKMFGRMLDLYGEGK